MAKDSLDTGIILFWVVIGIANWIWKLKKKSNKTAPKDVWKEFDGLEDTADSSFPTESEEYAFDASSNPLIAKKLTTIQHKKIEEETELPSSRQSELNPTETTCQENKKRVSTRLCFSGSELKKAIIMSEILSPPKAKKNITVTRT